MNGTEERRLTFDGADLTGVDWTGDGRSLVYSSDRAGGYTLWRIAAEGGTPALLAGGAARMKHPVADRSGRRVVYENWNYEINLAEKRFREPGGVVHSVTRTSDLWNLYPQVCPDDRRITYVSTQSGSHELWVADREGTNARQLTRLGDGIVKLPRWSPDGRRIVFLARGERSVDIYHVDVTTGDVTRVTSDSRQEVAPAWSADGARILFGAADEHGRWNVWSVNASDPADARVELRDAVAAQPSYDGHTLYFTRPNQSGVWRVSSSGARVERVVDGIDIGNTQGWSVMRDSIYFVEERGDTVYLRELTLMSGAIAEVAALPQFTWPGFSVSKDGAVLYAKWDRRESNLMSIEY